MSPACGTARLAARLKRDRRGVVAVIGALVILLVAGVSAYATDLARVQIAKARVQAAADAALLAAARDLGVNEAALGRLARAVFDANLVGAPRDLTVRSFDFTVSARDAGSGAQSVSLDVEIRLPLMMGGLGEAARLIDIAHVDLVTDGVAEKESMGLELVMVLDNTGSMNGSKIRDLRTAATALTRTLFGDAEAVPNLHVGIVNYSAAANIGRQHWDWLLSADAPVEATPPAAGRYAAPDFDAPAASLAEIDAAFAPTQWKGCVMARSAALSETDDPPAAGGRFAPQFWPSSILSHDPLQVDPFLTDDRRHINLWPPIEGYDRINNNSTLRDLLAEDSVTIDGDRDPVDERRNAGNDGYGPNLGCPAPFTPLTASRQAILDAIDGTAGVDGVDAWSRGGTFGNLGLAWGWRMLSPRWRGLWRDRAGVANPALPLSYDTPFNTKVVVMMTDGANMWFQTDYSAFGRQNDMIRRSDIDPSMLRLCQNIKDAGVIVYTVTFGGGVDNATRDTYRQCASNPATERRIVGPKYFHAPSGAQLRDAFGAIGNQVTEVRLKQ